MIYASRMILHPEAHMERLWGWLNRLEGGHHNHLPQAKREAKIQALKIRLGAPDAIQRTRRTGYRMMVAILAIELMVWVSLFLS
jgi:hypothetical protein